MNVQKVEKDIWKEHFSEVAHAVCFEERKPGHMDRIDFALLIVDKDDSPAGYLTCRELDSDTLYWQFGGVFPSIIGTIKSYRAYEACIDWAKTRYKRVTFFVENTNKPMLKFAMKSGAIITGIRNFNGSILLENLLEF